MKLGCFVLALAVCVAFHVASGAPKHHVHRVHLHAGKKVNVGAPEPAAAPAPAPVAAPVAAPAPAAPAAPLAAAKPGGETTTDYPFVVSDGPKANIHPLNSKIKMGDDHDGDLVDYYDEDDDSEDASDAAPVSDDDDGEDSESESESGDGDSHDSHDTAPKLNEDSPVKQASEEESGSGSGAVDFSGDEADELEEAPKKKKPGKKIRTKTFEFGVGELGGNNLPIVVPVISSKKPKDEDVKKDKGKAKKAKSAQAQFQGMGALTKNADVAQTNLAAATATSAANAIAPPIVSAAAPPVVAAAAAAAAPITPPTDIDLNQLTLDQAKSMMHDEANSMMIAHKKKVLKEREEQLKADEAALAAQETAMKEAKIKAKKDAEEKIAKEKAAAEEAVKEKAKQEKLKKVKEAQEKEAEKQKQELMAKAALKEKKEKEKDALKEKKEEKTKSVLKVKGKGKGKGKKTHGEGSKGIKEGGAKQPKFATKAKDGKGKEEWIIDMHGETARQTPLAKKAADLTAMKLPGVPASPAKNTKANNISPAEFLYDGIGSKIAGEIDKLTGKPQVPAAQSCVGLCLSSCDPKCPPGCCGRSGFPLNNGVTAQILPIPADLNKVIKDAGLGPGTTAQILPNDQNRQMLQQAGFAEGVTARIIPIPAGYSVTSNTPMDPSSLGRSSAAAPANLQISAPTRARDNPAPQPANANKESSQAPHPPLNPMAAAAAQAPIQANVQQQQQQQHEEATARDQGAQPSPLQTLFQDAAAKAARAMPPPPPAAAPPPPPQPAAPLTARIENLPEGEKNYDERVYKELLAQLPPSVAPEGNGLTPFQPLAVSQQLSQINVPDAHALGSSVPKVRKFFKSMKAPVDPLQNLEAYKRQEFKDYGEQFLDDDR